MNEITLDNMHTCAHPDCNVQIEDGMGGACKGEHSAWLSAAIAACDAGDPSAINVWDEVDQGGRHPERVALLYDPPAGTPVEDWEVGISSDPDAIFDPYKKGGE